jgi:hypothetical protein
VIFRQVALFEKNNTEICPVVATGKAMCPNGKCGVDHNVITRPGMTEAEHDGLAYELGGSALSEIDPSVGLSVHPRDTVAQSERVEVVDSEGRRKSVWSLSIVSLRSTAIGPQPRPRPPAADPL